VLGWAGAAVAQTPEQPDWSTDSQPEALETPAGAVEPDPPQESAQPTDLAGSSSVTAAASPAEGIGVPAERNFFLPDFGDVYGEPFFEWQELSLRLGPVHIDTGLALSTEYTDNLFGSYTNQVKDIISGVSPRFLVGVGDYGAQDEDFLRLDYVPTFNTYSQHPELNRVNQTLGISGRVSFSRFASTLEVSYLNINNPSAVDTGRENYQVLTAESQNTYFVTEKTFAQVVFGAILQSYEGGEEYETYSVSPVLGYSISGKTTLTFGPSAGISYIGSTQNSQKGTQTFQGVSVGAIYQYSPKLSAQGALGIQSRQFEGANFSGASNFTTPIYSLTIEYLASEKTTARVEFVRDVQLSDLSQGQTYTNSQAGIELSHAFRENFTFGMGLSYQYIEYQGSSTTDHTDQYVWFNPQLTYAFLRGRCRLSVYYRGQRRTSNIENFNYTINTYGVQISYGF
jgi:hypothetical protein